MHAQDGFFTYSLMTGLDQTKIQLGFFTMMLVYGLSSGLKVAGLLFNDSGLQEISTSRVEPAWSFIT